MHIHYNLTIQNMYKTLFIHRPLYFISPSYVKIIKATVKKRKENICVAVISSIQQNKAVCRDHQVLE